MAEVNNGEELSLPTKRCPDFATQDPSNGPKKQKLLDDDNSKTTPEPQQPSPINDVVQKGEAEEETLAELEERENKQAPEEQEQDEEHSNDKDVIDRKGKGILIEEEEDEDDDDDDSDSDSDSDLGIGENLSDDSDLADDPLAEVDLENILPSRTRRRSIQPGAYIANGLPDEDSDESDDPDA